MLFILQSDKKELSQTFNAVDFARETISPAEFQLIEVESGFEWGG